MNTRKSRYVLLLLSFCASSLGGFAQWRVLHPRILPPTEWHYVDSMTIRSFHSVATTNWNSRLGITGVSRDGGSTWSYEATAPPLGCWSSNITSFYSAREGYYLGAASDNPWTEDRVLYRTVDGGENWNPFRILSQLWIEWGFHSAREGFVDAIYPYSNDTRFITRDSGRSLTPVLFPHGAIIPFAENGPYLVLDDSTAWLSTDSGVSFRRSPFPAKPYFRTVSYSPDGHVWVLSKGSYLDDSAPITFARSSDYGVRWEAFSYPLVKDTENRPWALIFRDTLQGLALTSGMVRSTTDGGITWQYSTSVTAGDPNSYFTTFPKMLADPVSGHVLLMDGYWRWGWDVRDPAIRFRRSTDFGITWTTIPNSLSWEVRDVKRWTTRDLVALSIPTTTRYDIHQGPVDSVAVLVSRDDGRTWTERVVRPGLNQDHLTIFPNGGVLVGTSLYSDDYGETWRNTILPPETLPTAIPLFTKDRKGVTATQSDSLHVKILQSDDQGRSWRTSSLLELPYSGTGQAMRVIELPSGAWHLTFRFTTPSSLQAVYRTISLDRGGSWSSFQRITPTVTEYDDLEPKTIDGRTYLFARSGYPESLIFRSEDSGVTYSQMRIVHRYPKTWDQTFYFLVRDIDWMSDSVCYAMSGSGYCISRDGGVTWTPEEGLILEGIQRVIVGDSTEQWFVGIHGIILQHRGPLGIVTSADPSFPSPSDYSLPVTYPNPASSSSPAQVAFTLERDMPVGVFVYDLLGRRQRILHEGRLTVGPQRFTFGTAGLPPGLYFVAVSTPDGVRVGKVVVGS